MTAVSDLWFLADEASQAAAQAHHRLTETFTPDLERTQTRRVSRDRFRTLAERIRESGAPYGAHTIVYRPAGDLLLVRHEGVDQWVLPGGEVDGAESFQEAARRELAEEAGVRATYDGLAIAGRVEIRAAGYDTWGVLPVFAARAETDDPEVNDPDDEISRAAWFPVQDLPEDTRDRADLLAWWAEADR